MRHTYTRVNRGLLLKFHPSSSSSFSSSKLFSRCCSSSLPVGGLMLGLTSLYYYHQTDYISCDSTEFIPQDANVPYQNPLFNEVWQSIVPDLDGIAMLLLQDLQHSSSSSSSSSSSNELLISKLNVAAHKLANHNLLLAGEHMRNEVGQIEKLLDLMDSIKVMHKYAPEKKFFLGIAELWYGNHLSKEGYEEMYDTAFCRYLTLRDLFIGQLRNYEGYLANYDLQTTDQTVLQLLMLADGHAIFDLVSTNGNTRDILETLTEYVSESNSGGVESTEHYLGVGLSLLKVLHQAHSNTANLLSAYQQRLHSLPASTTAEHKQVCLYI